MKLSIVTTLYKSKDTVQDFYLQVSSVAQRMFGSSFEVILVNDGSPDESNSIAQRISSKDFRVTTLNLSRNFGHHHAIMAGLAEASGELVFLIDSDLEEDPSLLDSFYKKMRGEDLDVVYGVQIKRKGNWLERVSGDIFYTLFNSISEIKIPKNLSTVRLMSRSYVDSLLQFREQELFLGGIWHAVGYRQGGLEFHKKSNSQTSYSIGKKFQLAVRSLASFSSAPLVWLFGLGTFLSVSAFIYSAFLVVNWAFLSNPPSGWTSVLASIWLFGSLTLFSLGLLGIYLSIIFAEVKMRPKFIVQGKTTGRSEES